MPSSRRRRRVADRIVFDLVRMPGSSASPLTALLLRAETAGRLLGMATPTPPPSTHSNVATVFSTSTPRA